MVASSTPGSSESSSRAISGVPEPPLERREVSPSLTSSAVTVDSGPGYGKSTLIASWAERGDCACMPSTIPTSRSASSSSGATSASPEAAEAARGRSIRVHPPRSRNSEVGSSSAGLTADKRGHGCPHFASVREQADPRGDLHHLGQAQARRRVRPTRTALARRRGPPKHAAHVATLDRHACCAYPPEPPRACRHRRPRSRRWLSLTRQHHNELVRPRRQRVEVAG
jgi:hypothetical protein